MKGAPRSKHFDDVYFSAENGLEETRHVFLDGNGLPAAWQDRPHFTIAETGFGTGLNFLAAWTLFEETAGENQRLDFISFEKYPLAAEEIRDFLQPWAQEFGGRLARLTARYPLRVPGFHKIVFDRVTLTLVFDDVNTAMPELDAKIDAWFLDGFRPAANPEMWTGIVFREMARLGNPGATFATFTVAGDVRRGLEEAGFEIHKRPGFGRKREMLAGRKS